MLSVASLSGSQRSHRFTCLLLGLFVGLLSLGASAQADDFVVRSRNGAEQELEGEVTFENDQLLFSIATDGHVMRLEKNLILKRTPAPPPAYLSPDDMHKYLVDSFGIEESKLRSKVTPDCLVFLSLERPLPDDDQTKKRVDDYLNRIVQVYQQSAKGVEAFAKQQGLKQKKPRTPAVIFIIESPLVASSTFQNTPGIQAAIRYEYRNGWYDPYYNIAKFKMDDVIANDGKMGEVLVWQQLFHTGILNRPAPVPLWLMAALSSGFEESASQLKPAHQTFQPHIYAWIQQHLKSADWNLMVSNYVNGKFRENNGDYLWFPHFHITALHWYLITKEKAGYAKYLQLVSALTPLDDPSDEKMLADFKKAFGKEPNDFKKLFETEFLKVSKAAAKTSPIAERKPEDDFEYTDRRFFATTQLNAKPISPPFHERMDGQITNKSPFRRRTYDIGIKTLRGDQSVWVIDNVEPGQTVKLTPKDVRFLENAPKVVEKKVTVKNADGTMRTTIVEGSEPEVDPKNEKDGKKAAESNSKPAKTGTKSATGSKPATGGAKAKSAGTKTEKSVDIKYAEKPSTVAKKNTKTKEKSATKAVQEPEKNRIQNIWVLSVPADSAEADQWKNGKLPYEMTPDK